MSEVFDKIEQLETKTIPVSQGGTGATTAEEALKNLGITNINPNLLDNWYFANPVNQQGKTEYIGGVYGIDRWKGEFSTSIVTLSEDGLIFSDNGNGYCRIFQNLENYNELVGKRVTFSAIIDNQLYSCNFRLGGGSGGYTMGNMRAYSVSDKHVILQSTQGNRNIVKAVKLELGTQQTLAREENGVWVLNEIPNYADEYAKCKQYSPFTGKYVGLDFANPNLLNNGDFQIWQNGTNFSLTGGYTYTADRFRIFTQGNATVVKDGSMLKLTAAHDKVNAVSVVMDANKEWLGKTMTLSYDIKASESIELQIFAWNGDNFTSSIAATSYYANTSVKRVAMTFTVPSTLTDNKLHIWIVRMGAANGKSLWIGNCKLELGSAATQFYSRTYAEEMAICKQYNPTTGEYIGLTAGAVGARPNTWIPTASEVGAFSTSSIIPISNGGTGANNAASARANIHAMTDYEIINNVDLDTFVTPGFYHSNCWINYPAAHADAQGTVINISYMQSANINSAWAKQIFISPHDGKIWWRNHNHVTWLTDWQSIPFSSTPMSFSVNSSGGLRITY